MDIGSARAMCLLLVIFVALLGWQLRFRIYGFDYMGVLAVGLRLISFILGLWFCSVEDEAFYGLSLTLQY